MQLDSERIDAPPTAPKGAVGLYATRPDAQRVTEKANGQCLDAASQLHGANMNSQTCANSSAAAPVNESATDPVPVDDFFPSGRFAKVPAEALGPLATEGAHRMEHTEFHLFVALCRFRGRAQVVNPCQETLAKMTRMARNNVSRAAHGLQAKGWVRLHHKDGNIRKAIENYELLIPQPGKSPGVEPQCPPDSEMYDAMDDEALYRSPVDIDSEPMSAEELEEALTQLKRQEA